MNPLSQLPSVDRLLTDPAVATLVDSHGRAVITQLVRKSLAGAREAARAGTPLPDAANLIATVSAGACRLARVGEGRADELRDDRAAAAVDKGGDCCIS